MRLEEVRTLLRRQPFHAFTSILPDGHRVVVPHHDCGILSADGRTLFVHELENVGRMVTLIDVMLIAGIQTVRPAPTADL